MTTIELDDELAAALEREARSMGWSVSEYVGQKLRSVLNLPLREEDIRAILAPLPGIPRPGFCIDNIHEVLEQLDELDRLEKLEQR